MNELFKVLGLNENEQSVYLTVLKYGKLSPVRTAKETGINRTTVYSIAKKLAAYGLIAEDLGQKVTYLVAESPDKIMKNLEEEEKLLKSKKEAAGKLIDELNTLKKQITYSVPRIRFIDELNLREHLYNSYERWCASAIEKDDNTWRGFQDPTFTKEFKDWIDWTWEQDKTNSLKGELFLADSVHEKSMGKKYERRGMKILPKDITFDSSFWVAGDYIILAQTRYKPFYLVEIHDPVMARNQRNLFKWLWKNNK